MSGVRTEPDLNQLKERLDSQRQQLTKNQIKKRRKQLAKLSRQGQPALPDQPRLDSQECCSDVEEGCSIGAPCERDAGGSVDSVAAIVAVHEQKQRPRAKRTRQARTALPWKAGSDQLLEDMEEQPSKAPCQASDSLGDSYSLQQQRGSAASLVPGPVNTTSQARKSSRRDKQAGVQDPALPPTHLQATFEPKRLQATTGLPPHPFSSGVCRVDLSCSLLMLSQSVETHSVRQSTDSTAFAVSYTAHQASMDTQLVSDHEPAGDSEDLEEQPEEQQVRKRQRRTYVHGNYRHYYGYRLGGELAEPGAEQLPRDPRLEVLRREWFRGKRCVDIGCNEGVITLAVAAEFGTARMLGVDIDRALVAGAARRLATLRQQYTEQLTQWRLGAGGPHHRAAAGSRGAVAGSAAPAASDAGVPGSPAGTEGGGAAVGVAAPSPASRAPPPSGAVGNDELGQSAGRRAAAGLASVGPVPAGTLQPFAATGGAGTARSPPGGAGRRAAAALASVGPAAGTPLQLAAAIGDAAAAGSPPCREGEAVAEAAAEEGAGAASGEDGGPAGPEVSGSRWAQLRTAVKALAHTSFRHEDWVSTPSKDGSADVVMCLSVTKWVHLNGGDDALMRLFHKVFRELAPGGLFVLEPQPWKSYQQAKRKQDMSAAPFSDLKRLQLRPHQFTEFLTQRVGFTLLHELRVRTAAGGFVDRPIYVLQKPG